MHKVIKINEFAATRMVELQNELTGNIDICFDDSALVSINNFEFMKVGNRYNCFIELFGEMAEEGISEAVTCKIISNERIGNGNFLKVFVGKEIYYVPRSQVGSMPMKEFLFAYTRKDLIKVDEVIHEDLLNE